MIGRVTADCTADGKNAKPNGGTNGGTYARERCND